MPKKTKPEKLSDLLPELASNPNPADALYTRRYLQRKSKRATVAAGASVATFVSAFSVAFATGQADWLFTLVIPMMMPTQLSMQARSEARRQLKALDQGQGKAALNWPTTKHIQKQLEQQALKHHNGVLLKEGFAPTKDQDTGDQFVATIAIDEEHEEPLYSIAVVHWQCVQEKWQRTELTNSRKLTADYEQALQYRDTLAIVAAKYKQAYDSIEYALNEKSMHSVSKRQSNKQKVSWAPKMYLSAIETASNQHDEEHIAVTDTPDFSICVLLQQHNYAKALFLFDDIVETVNLEETRKTYPVDDLQMALEYALELPELMLQLKAQHREQLALEQTSGSQEVASEQELLETIEKQQARQQKIEEMKINAHGNF